MKKIIACLILVASLFTLTSCLGLVQDPVNLGKKLNDAYGDDASIYIIMSREDIKYFCEDLEISDNGVYALMEIDAGHNEAYIIYCDNSTQAETIEKELLVFLKNNVLEEENYTVERAYTTVFVGSNSILRKIKK